MPSELLHPLPGREHDDCAPLLAAFDAARPELAAMVEISAAERDLQAFLQEHPILLLHAMLDGFYPVASRRSALFPKVRLGTEFEADFLYYSGNSMGMYWTFVELEPSHVRLFTKAGDPSAQLSHALRQVHDWQAWLSDYREYALGMFERLVARTGMQWNWPRHFRRPCQSVIVIGRRGSLTKETNRLRAQLCASHGSLEIIAWDRLFDPYAVDKQEHVDASTDEVRPVRDFIGAPRSGELA